LFCPVVNNYIGYPAAWFVVAILFVKLGYSLITSLLNGLHLVHVVGPLSTLKTGGRSLLQIGALVAAFELVGLFVGHIIAFLIVGSIGGVIVFHRLNEVALPRKRHFEVFSIMRSSRWSADYSRGYSTILMSSCSDRLYPPV
jgi:hypothetical protein